MRLKQLSISETAESALTAALEERGYNDYVDPSEWPFIWREGDESIEEWAERCADEIAGAATDRDEEREESWWLDKNR